MLLKVNANLKSNIKKQIIMKRFWKIVSIALICGALVSPQLEARGRNDRGNSRTEHRSGQSSASRPNRGNNKASHPKKDNNVSTQRSNNNHQRPSGAVSNNRGRNHNDMRQPQRGNNHSSHNNHNHAVRPPQHHHSAPSHNHHHHHVSRPHCPPPRPYHRPVPPPSFRAYHGCPVLRSIVGITFGTAINLSLDYLNRNGYTVHGYGNDVVYLRNISQYGYNWPDATLYYSSHGLVGSEFVYSTSYNSRSRYNSVYNTLYNQYGAPISVDSSANGVTVTWWGYDNQYVSLDYHPIYTNNGQLRYVTTLSMGM